MRILAWPADLPSNPYPRLLFGSLGPQVDVDDFSAKKLTRSYSVWHLHWPDYMLKSRSSPRAAFGVSKLLVALDWMRLRGTKIVWTIHNLCSHEGYYPRLERLFWGEFSQRVDGVISLSSSGLAAARERFPSLLEVPSAVIPHGHYRSAYLAPDFNIRQQLGIPPSARMLLFAGLIRSYKNVDKLVRVFRETRLRDALLYIVGHADCPSLAEKIRSEAERDSRIRIMFKFLSNEELSSYITAADLVVLPYREILNSGSAILSLSLNRPVLVPQLGAMAELREDIGERWVQTFTGDLDPSVLEKALEWVDEKRPAECFFPEKYNWKNIGAETLHFYRQVVLTRQESEQAALLSLPSATHCTKSINDVNS